MYTSIKTPPKYLGDYLVRFEHKDKSTLKIRYRYEVCELIDYETEAFVHSSGFVLSIPGLEYWTPTHWAEIPKLTPDEPTAIIEYMEHQ